MGYHITLVRSPPRAITWSQLSGAGRKLGWDADAAAQEVRLHEADRLVARVWLGDDGEPWSKLMDEEELGHLITLAGALGARARGDEFESYRSMDDWFVHPDDQADRNAADRASRARPARPAQTWRGRLLVVGVFMVVGLTVRLAEGWLQ